MNKNAKTIFLMVLLTMFLLPLGAEKYWGDTNGDGQVTIVDALVLAQVSVGIYPFGFQENVGDVNLDHLLSVVDALMIAQKYVGLLSEFPAEVTYAGYQQQLTEAENRWLGFSNYWIVERVHCFCPDSGVSYKLEVRNGKIVGVYDSVTGAPVQNSIYIGLKTIDELFNQVRRALSEKYYIFRLSFDSEWGYVDGLALDPIFTAVDDEVAFDIDSFQYMEAIQPTGKNITAPGFGVQVSNPLVTGDQLSLNFAYSGCSEHEIILFSGLSFMESAPPQLNVLLYDRDALQMCDAYFTVKESFDLTPVRDLYKETYGSGGSVILNINANGQFASDNLIRVVYTFE